MNPLFEILSSFGNNLTAVVAVFIACTSFTLADTILKAVIQGDRMIYSAEDPQNSIELVKIDNSLIRKRARCFYVISLLCSAMIGMLFYSVS
tara:strand:- start:56 stop:331 length:276 start_codon:yes stop_codon:yes gene_type:complete